MKGFRQRLKRAINKSGQYSTDVYGLAEDAGLGRKTIYNMLSDKNLDNSSAGPGIFGMSRVALLLGTSLDYLAGQPVQEVVRSAPTKQPYKMREHIFGSLSAQEEEKHNALSADRLLRTHLKSGGRVEAFAPWIDHCDCYCQPAADAQSLTVKFVGNSSLSALTMGSNDKGLLQTALSEVTDTSLKQRWVRDYQYAVSAGTNVSIEALDVQMPNHPVHVRMDFIRCLLAVTDANDEKSVLNFSMLVV
jgi:hypothetical protein